MSNIVHFPAPGGASVSGCESFASEPFRCAPFAAEGARLQGGSWHLGSRLLNEPPPHAHAVQFYDDEAFMLDTVALFVSAGLAAGDAALIIATRAHTEGILSRIPEEARDGALARGQLALVDAEAMLARFMRGGEVVQSLFEAALAQVFERLGAGAGRVSEAAATAPCRLRAFGEMVDLLWKSGNSAAAIRLEELWHYGGTRQTLVLLCCYRMRNFYKAGDRDRFGELCRLHTHVMPTEQFARRAPDDFTRLRDISVLEQRARSLASEVAYREELEGALRAFDERSAGGPKLPLRLDAGPVVGSAATEIGVRPAAALRSALSRLPGLLQAALATSRRLAASRLPAALAREAGSRARTRRPFARSIDAAGVRPVLGKTRR